MECKTKTGLLLLMISVIAGIISTIVMYGVWYSVDLNNLTAENATDLILTIVPASIIGLIGGLISLIGALLILLGRNEFGEKHKQFIFYAIIIFVISIIVGIATAGITVFATFSTMGESFGTSYDPNQAINFYRDSNFMTIIAAMTPISTALGGLMWVFALYQLENKNGRTILSAALICMIATSIVVGFISISTFNNYINSEDFENLINLGSDGSSSFTQLSSSYQWIGPSAIISLIGNTITNVLLFFGLYIPYNRIKSGDIVPVSTASESDVQGRICPNCGRSIPFDANICPYCSKRFEDYL